MVTALLSYLLWGAVLLGLGPADHDACLSASLARGEANSAGGESARAPGAVAELCVPAEEDMTCENSATGDDWTPIAGNTVEELPFAGRVVRPRVCSVGSTLQSQGIRLQI
jgi:hypothetical protein